jgi:ABC-2 type transport system permease protein
MSLTMPVLTILFFGFIMEKTDTGISSPINYLISGTVIMIVFQGAVGISDSVMEDMSSGFMKEMIVAPISRESIALGNILSAAILSSLQGLIGLLCGFVFGFRMTFPTFLLMLILMFVTGVISSAAALLMELIAKNQTNYQILTMFLMITLTFFSGAYIPTTILPKTLMLLVYLNPLTYLIAAFRYVSMEMQGMEIGELVSQGIAFPIREAVITPKVGLILVVAIGAILFILCVRRFKKVDLSSIKTATSRN